MALPPSPRVLLNRQVRIDMHRTTLTALQLGMADALLEIGEAILADAVAHAPRDAEAAAARGVPMMADTGGVQVWALGKRAGGVWEKRPRGGATPHDQVVMFVGFGSPLAHFAELGTIKENARPFLLPAFNRHIGNLAGVVVPAMGKRARAA